MRDVLTASDEPAVVVAHSYGGIVTAEAAVRASTPCDHLLLISSYLPEVGQSLSSFGGEEPAPFLEIDPEGGTFTVRGETLAETFLQDCDPEIQRRGAGEDGLAEPRGAGGAGAVGGVAARALDLPRLRARTGAPRPTGSASSPPGRPASWSSTPATTRSSRGPPRSAT